MTAEDSALSRLLSSFRVPVSGESVFGLVWRGWFAGVMVIFLPIAIIAILITALRGAWNETLQMSLGLIAVPVIAAGQGLIAGGLVALGLTVWPKKKQ
jgi:hypothetical protein